MKTKQAYDDRYFSISVVARILGVHQQTLRIYEKEGLIKPARTRGNTRLYSERDVEDIRLILRLTNELGVNLAGVGVILQMRRQMESMETEFDERMHRVIEELLGQFFLYMQQNTCLPVLSFKQGLIIKDKGNI